jgi:phage tail sheath protein FI
MANFLGIRVQEESGPEQAIPRVPTARAAFVGRTLRGPVDRPVRIQSFAEFQRMFGGLWQPSPLGYAVEHFFDNGGKDAVVVRVVNGARAATLSLPTGADPLVLEAKRPGTREFLRACVDYDNIPASDQEHFNLTVQRVRAHGTEHVEDQEIFRAVSLSGHADLPMQAALGESELVRVKSAAPGLRPKCTLDAGSGLATGYVQSNSDGDDGGPLTDYDLIGSAIKETGIFALNQIEHFNFLCIPPLSREQDVGPSALLVAARYCKERRSMLILDPPLQWATTDDALRGLRDWHIASENAVMYFPRILAHDKLRGRFECFAPSGAVAGMLARSDEIWPVWSAAEGEEPVLRPGFRPVCIVSEDRRTRLAALGVNTLQSIRSAPRLSLSPRTMAAGTAGSADWKYLSARRLALFIVNSIERGTRWIVFSPIGAEIADRVQRQVTEFFEALNDEGAFLGRAEGDAYFVICDDRVNPVHVDGVRRFNILIGFAAMRAGEFHSYLVTHSVAGSGVKPVSLNRMSSSHYHPAQAEDLNPEEREWVERLAGRLS